MADQPPDQPSELERTNALLRASLQQCRAMVADYRGKIAANRNDRPAGGSNPTTGS